jgi:HAD superfamily hydrolase (TIGR01493 family)
VALIVFDLNGTLLDPAGADQRLAQALPKAVQLAMAHDLHGDFRPLAALLVEIDPELDPELATRMPPLDGVADQLERLATDGHRLAVLTNSARQTAEEALSHAGVLHHFHRVESAEEAGVHKPHPRAYAFGEERIGRPDLFVASHAWDRYGATRAGWRAAPGLDGIADAVAG